MQTTTVSFSKAITLDQYDASCAVPINEIMPGLFLGNAYGAGKSLGKLDTSLEKLDTLKKKGITHILCCTKPAVKYFPDQFAYKCIEIDDDSSVSLGTFLPEAYDFIEEGIAGGGVFVHCSAGSSRSASIVIAYLMRKRSLGYDEAFGFVQEKRPCVKPNPGFEKQLRLWNS